MPKIKTKKRLSNVKATFRNSARWREYLKYLEQNNKTVAAVNWVAPEIKTKFTKI